MFVDPSVDEQVLDEDWVIVLSHLVDNRTRVLYPFHSAAECNKYLKKHPELDAEWIPECVQCEDVNP